MNFFEVITETETFWINLNHVMYIQEIEEDVYDPETNLTSKKKMTKIVADKFQWRDIRDINDVIFKIEYPKATK